MTFPLNGSNIEDKLTNHSFIDGLNVVVFNYKLLKMFTKQMDAIKQINKKLSFKKCMI